MCVICQELCPFNKDRGNYAFSVGTAPSARELLPSVAGTFALGGDVLLPLRRVNALAEGDQAQRVGPWRLGEGDGAREKQKGEGDSGLETGDSGRRTPVEYFESIESLPDSDSNHTTQTVGKPGSPPPNPRSLTPIPPHGASPTTEPAFQPRDITVNSTVQDLLLLTEEEFRENREQCGTIWDG